MSHHCIFLSMNNMRCMFSGHQICVPNKECDILLQLGTFLFNSVSCIIVM